MATRRYGFDSCSCAYSTLINDAKTCYNNGSNTASFWCRYFAPSPSSCKISDSSSKANRECHCLFSKGIKYLVPICSPAQSRLNDTSVEGQADATTFCDAVNNVYGWVSPLLFSSLHILYTYLDIEAGTTLSSGYWNGWANYVNAFAIGFYAPLYASFYGKPCQSQPNCSTAVSPDAFAVWSSHNSSCGQTCSGECKKFGNVAWNPSNCFNGLPTRMWQMAIYSTCLSCSTCSPVPVVDIDETTTVQDLQDYMFFISSDPVGYTCFSGSSCT